MEQAFHTAAASAIADRLVHRGFLVRIAGKSRCSDSNQEIDAARAGDDGHGPGMVTSAPGKAGRSFRGGAHRQGSAKHLSGTTESGNR